MQHKGTNYSFQGKSQSTATMSMVDVLVQVVEVAVGSGGSQPGPPGALLQ